MKKPLPESHEARDKNYRLNRIWPYRPTDVPDRFSRQKHFAAIILGLFLGHLLAAQLLSAEDTPVFTVKSIGPYKEATDALGRTLLLIPRGQKPPEGLKPHQFVEVPVQRTASLSGTYDLGIMKALGLLDTLIGLANPENQSTLPELIQDHENGRLPYLGLWNAPDYETVKTLKPDLILNGDFRSLDIFEAMGCPAIFTFTRAANTLEDRLRFIKFLAAFYGQDQLADSLVLEVRETLKELAEKSQDLKKPKVLYADFWQEKIQILPSDFWSSQIITLAGGDLLFPEVTGHLDVSIDPEAFYLRGRAADIYIPYRSSMYGYLTKSDLLKAHPLLNRFKVMEPNGRVFRPENIMYSDTGKISEMARDLAAVIAPELYPIRQLKYFAYVP
ncbi:MAG: ABC transporter substrate-binding protein [Deltaproteobacteria bacterium]|jgi:iron complex transport system substrate-binding protein|nr:ABC transporter substrate-binding protein [Deltaproteobacteria bacterium]